MHVGIFKTNHLGDNVVFLPVVQALRRLRPQWRITLITAPPVAPLYEADVTTSDLLTIDPDAMKRAWRSPAVFARWWSRLRQRHFDASLISYDQSSSAHILARWSGGPIRVGAAGLRIRARSGLTDSVAWRPGWTIAKWNWEMMRVLVTHLDSTVTLPDNPIPPDVSHLTSGAQPAPRRIVFHAGSKWERTRWPLPRFVTLAERLAADYDVCWINTPEARHESFAADVRVVEASDLGSLARLLAGAALFVGNNSGPMHLANAVSTPIVAITGSSDFAWDPAWHRDRVTVLRTPNLPCAPCERVQYAPDGCHNTLEPLACLMRWDVDAVYSACRSLLAAA
jgi:ADP-heptose:LPS heptosyltransferase